MSTKPPQNALEKSLVEIWAHATEAQENFTEAQKARDRAVRNALNQGLTIIRIRELTGLTRSRIYQIRDNRR